MTRKYTINVFRDRKKEYRFKVYHSNGNVIFQSSESYKKKATLKRVLKNTLFNLSIGNYIINEI